MSSEQLVRNCAPTLAGIKTGSLYAIQGVDMDELKCDLSALNRTLISKGVRIIPLKMSDDKVLIYIYRPQMLKKDLSDPGLSINLLSIGFRPDCKIRPVLHHQNNTGYPG
jgi:hypothetical protein